MSSDQATVQFKASIDELLKGIADATGALQRGFASVNETVKQTSASIEQQLGAAAESTSQQIQELGSQTRNAGEQIEGIGEKVEFAFNFAVVKKAKDFLVELVARVRELGAAASDVLDTAYAFGVTARELQGLNALATQTGTDFNAVNRTLLILQNKLLEAAQGSREAQDALATFGITAQQFNDAAFTSVDALVKIAQSSTSAAERIQLFGRNNVSVLGVLGPLESGIGAVGRAAEATGAATREQLEALAGFNSFVATLELQFTNLESRVLSGVVPALKEMYRALTDLIDLKGPLADVLGVAIKGLGLAIQGVATVTIGVVYIVKTGLETIVYALKLAVDGVIGFGLVWDRVIRGDFKGAWEVGKAVVGQVKSDFNAMTENVIDGANNAALAAKRMFDALGGDSGPNNLAAPGDSSTEARPDRGSVKARKQETDAVAEEIKLQLDLAKQGSEQRIELANQLVARMLQVYGRDSEQFRSAIRTQAEAVKQFSEEQRKLAEARLQINRDAAFASLDVAKAAFEQEAAQRAVSIDEQYKKQQEFAERRLQIETAYYEQLKALRTEDAVAQEQAQADIAEAQQTRTQEGIEAMTQKFQQSRQQWEGILAPISSAFSGAVQGMIQGTETLSNAVRKMALNILLSFADLAVKKTVRWIAGEIAMTQATAANSATRAALEDAGAKKGILSGAFAALKKIAQFAATAAAGAFQAIVGIPYVGPFLAPAAAVAAGAAVLALGKSIASAAGGWVVPSDQLAMVHKDEMILPARLSSGLQSMIMSNPSGSSGETNINFNVSSMDSRDVASFFKKNGRAIAATMFEQASRFNPNTAPMSARGMSGT